MNKKELYVYMLVYVDNNWADIANNEYPTEGFVIAKNFTYDIDISNGLYGILWGKTNDYFLYEKFDKGRWLVIKTEFNDDIINTDYYHNRYKFKQGWISHSGDILSASEFIVSNKDNLSEGLINESLTVKPHEIAGTKEWFKEYNIRI